MLTLAIPYLIMLRHTDIEAEQSLCPFMMLTGLPCPGCGITKSLIFLYQGQMLKSFYYHLFGPFAFLFCIAAIVVLATELVTKREYLNKYFYSKRLAYAMGFALAFYHVARLGYYISEKSISAILHNSVWY